MLSHSDDRYANYLYPETVHGYSYISKLYIIIVIGSEIPLATSNYWVSLYPSLYPAQYDVVGLQAG